MSRCDRPPESKIMTAARDKSDSGFDQATRQQTALVKTGPNSWIPLAVHVAIESLDDANQLIVILLCQRLVLVGVARGALQCHAKLDIAGRIYPVGKAISRSAKAAILIFL